MFARPGSVDRCGLQACMDIATINGFNVPAGLAGAYLPRY
jgi:hypothetical protein